MSGTFNKAVPGAAPPGWTELALGLSAAPAKGRRTAATGRAACFHCGEPCPDDTFSKGEKLFCCQGCQVVHELLAESGLGQFYELSPHPGVRIRQVRRPAREQWAYLDEPELQARLLDFTDGKLSRVTFHIPAIHCVACVWLLENLFRLNPAIGESRVNFPRREVAISYAAEKLALSELVALLASIGYEPRLTLGELERREADPAAKRRWLQLGIAGFAFGNIMLLTIPTYLGLDSLSSPLFKALFGYISLALAAPVVCYSASDYWRSAWVSLRQRMLTLDVPIALGLAALYAQSAWEIVSGRGPGYLDSLVGLVFFLLCGRAFQRKTYDRLAFDLDYKCFFPLSATRKTAAGEESVALSNLRVGNRLLLRNGELIPADARLISGPACIDYSFVTGESEPVAKQPGDYLYAGGKQLGGAIEIETVKAVSQSYLTSLWNHEAFQKVRDDNLNTLTNRYSRRFTRLVIAVAAGAALFWFCREEGPRALKAFTSVLIVACPCALALAAPFALGTAQRLLGRFQVFLRNAAVLERIAQVDTIVLDKTGTLTEAQANSVRFVPMEHESLANEVGRVRPGAPSSAVHRRGAPGRTRPTSPAAARETSFQLSTFNFQPSTILTATEQSWVYSLAQHSTHPHAVRIAQSLMMAAREADLQPSTNITETAGHGLVGTVAGHDLRLGSRAWLELAGISVPESPLPPGSVSHLAIDGQYRGTFVLANTLRPEADRLLACLDRHYEIALLSGDNEKERELFRSLFGSNTHLHFNQSPLDKLGFIRQLQAAGKTVMMVGDGLNDAGALQQSDVGVALVEKVGTFSPASDVILEAAQVTRLFGILSLARKSAKVIRFSFGISALYNVIGISIAAAGVLSPLICAVLMPLSSISVVLFACAATNRAAKTAGFVIPHSGAPTRNTLDSEIRTPKSALP